MARRAARARRGGGHLAAGRVPAEATPRGSRRVAPGLFHAGRAGVGRPGRWSARWYRQRAVPRRWPQPLVERLQLLSEILGAALQRRRHESALRANVTVIERLNARLEADNVYLKEEIKSYHDFDDIVGESAALRLALARAGAGRADELERAAARPDRNRQGTVRARAARAEPAARAPAGAGQLRGAAADAGRKRAVRPREGRLHRRGGDAAGTLRAGRRRHDLPGRDRRPAAGHPGEVSARAAGRRVRARRVVAARSAWTCA